MLKLKNYAFFNKILLIKLQFLIVNKKSSRKQCNFKLKYTIQKNVNRTSVVEKCTHTIHTHT